MTKNIYEVIDKLITRKDMELRKAEIRCEKYVSLDNEEDFRIKVFEKAYYTYMDEPEKNHWEASDSLYNADYYMELARALGLATIVIIQDRWGDDREFNGCPCVKIW